MLQADHISDFLSAIAAEGPVPAHEIETFLTNATTLWQTIDAGLVPQDMLSRIADALATAVHHGDARKEAVCLCLLYKIFGRADYYLEAVARALKDKGASFDDRVATLNAITRLTFLSDELGDRLPSLVTDDYLDSHYAAQVDSLRAFVEQQGISRARGTEGGRVVLIVQQMLGPTHAPTRNMLEMAAILVRDYGKEVLCINSGEFGSQAAGHLLPFARFNRDEGFHGLRAVSYKDMAFHQYQSVEKNLTPRAVVELSQLIASYDPEMIVGLGGQNYLVEIFSDTRFTFMIPTGNGYPRTRDAFFQTYGPLDTVTDKALIQKGSRDRLLITEGRGFSVPQPERLDHTRAELGLPDDRFVVAIISTRLEEDISTTFIEQLRSLSEAEPRILFWFLGCFTGCENLTLFEPLAEAYHFGGFQSDLSGVLGVADAVLNPPRQGGGSGFVAAMVAGLIPYTLDFGDCATPAREIQVFTDFEGLARHMQGLIDDASERQRLKDQARMVGEKWGSFQPLVEKLMQQLEIKAARVPAEGTSR